MLYLILNKTIRGETRKLLLKLLCVNVENLSQQNRTEFNRAHNHNDYGDDEMIERAPGNNLTQQDTHFHVTWNRIAPIRNI